MLTQEAKKATGTSMERPVMHAEARPQRWPWLIGIILLVGSVFGVRWFMNDTSSGGTSAPEPIQSPPPPMIVSLGLVDVEPGVTQLHPLQSGRVIEAVAEGAEVKKGAVVLKLDNPEAASKAIETKADLDSAQMQHKLALLLPEQHARKKEQQAAALQAAKHQRESTYHEYQSKVELAKISETPLNKAIKSIYEEMVKKLDAVIDAEQAKLRELELFDPQPKAEIARAQADVNAKKARYDLAQRALEECILKAPFDGTVLRVLVNPGELVTTNARLPAVQFAANGPKIVRAEVLQEWAGRIRVGQEVEIEDDTSKGPSWKGTVKRIAPWFSEKRNRVLEPFMVNDVRTLECIVEVTSEDAKDLRIHQRVRVKIKQ